MSPIYAKNFLISYAKHLGLDHDLLVKELFPPPAPVQPEPQAKSTPKETKKVHVKTYSIPKIPINEIAMPLLRIVPAAAGIAILVVLFKVIPFADINSRVSHQEASLSVQAKQQAPSDALVSLQATQPLELSLKARRPSWVSIKADGKLIAQQRLDSGSQETWKARRRLELVIGTPANVEVLLNGQSISPLAMAHRGRLLITHSKIRPLEDEAAASTVQASSR
jgi:cytoskeletal protein RodZ